MAETSFASLSPTLLARKGGAKPAMRPQHAALASMPAAMPDSAPEPEHLEDLGWNDMGDGENAGADIVQLNAMPRTSDSASERATERASERAPEPATESSRPAVLRHQDAIAQRIAAPAPLPKRRAAAAGRAAFTLRLDAHRHLKLRLATTIRGVSAQALVTDALDVLLADMPELDTLAAQVKRR